jgi:AcrR family transcriptional regulator
LQAAAQVLLHEGVAGFNTNRIAERAGVSIGTLYQYFPDKQAVLDRLLIGWRDAVVAQIDEVLGAALVREAPAHEAVAVAVRVVLQAFAGADAQGRALARMAWQMDKDDSISRAMRVAAERLGLHLQHWASLRGAAITMTQVYVVTRAVLGVVRYASLEASPLLDSPAFEAELTRMALAVLLPDEPAQPVAAKARRRAPLKRRSA